MELGLAFPGGAVKLVCLPQAMLLLQQSAYSERIRFRRHGYGS
jgi:hypothetical protein